MNFIDIANAVGYRRILYADNARSLKLALAKVQSSRELTFLEARVAIGSRPDLGRPTTTPRENKAALMHTLSE